MSHPPVTIHHENLRLWLQIVIALFMAIGAWFAKEVWEGQKSLAITSATRFETLSKQIASLDKDAAVTQANRFTAVDWTKANEVIMTRFNINERRLDRHDDTLSQISETLQKIETSLQK